MGTLYTRDGAAVYAAQVRMLKKLEAGELPRKQTQVRSLLSLERKGVIRVRMRPENPRTGKPSENWRKYSLERIRILIPSRHLCEDPAKKT